MRKSTLPICCVLLCIFMILACTGCAGKPFKGEDKRVAEAIALIQNRWNEVYEDRNIEDKYLEITNTKLINIKDNDDSFFSDIDYIVEFSLQTNIYDSAPYYCEVGIRDSFVVVYEDGHKETMGPNPFQQYIQRNGPTDFSDIIESVEDFHGEYDGIITPGDGEH